MIPNLVLQVLSDKEMAKTHSAMLSILSQTGLEVEHAQIRKVLAEYGAEIDSETQRVRFPERVIERFLNETERIDYSSARPSLSAGVGIYQGLYLEAGTNRMLPFTEQTLADYVKLARLLDNVTGVHMLNYPVAAGSPTEPLELRVFAWKHGAQETGSIQLTELCPYLLEMYEIKADADGKPLSEIFRGLAFMISPLRIPAHEAEQMVYFHERGLRVGLNNMITAGGSGPVTLAGCLALNLAERVAIGIIDRVLYGDPQWNLSSSIAPLDMSTMIQPYGRPESLLANLASMQLARHYGVPGTGHCGLTDAKLPSNEAGVQKLLTALPCMLAGSGNIQPGLLSIDEVFSPIQMILDDELVGALRHVIRGFEINDNTLAVKLIDEIGPGGFFTATNHTAEYYHTEQWQPHIWSREMVQRWRTGSAKIDAERALDVWHDLMSRPDPEPGISEQTETRLRALVERAARQVSVAQGNGHRSLSK